MTKDTLKIAKGELILLSYNNQDNNHKNSYKWEIAGWRQTTLKEDEAWTKYVNESPLDDAGEPRVRPSISHTTDYLPNDTSAIVIKARCTAYIGWNRVGKLVQIMVPSNGNTYYVLRRHVKKMSDNENSVHE